MSLLLREAIGGTIRRARTERRRTLRDVSGEARVSLGYLSEIERGRKEPSSELLAAICDALELPLPELLDDVADALRPDHARDPAARRPARPVRPVLAPVDPALLSAVEEALEAAADAAEPSEGPEGAVAEPASPDAPAVEGPVDSAAPAAASSPAGGEIAGGRLVPLVAVGSGPGDVARIVCSAA